MPFPSIEQFAVFATALDIGHSPQRLAEAYQGWLKVAADLERLRAIPLTYTGEVIEPSHGLAFITESMEE